MKNKHDFDERLVNSKFSFTKNFKWFALGSGCLIFIGIIILCIFGFNLGLDFTGGSQIKVKMGSVLEQKVEYDKNLDIIKTAFNNKNVKIDSIQKEGSGSDLAIVIRFRDIKGKDSSEMEDIRLDLVDKIQTDITAANESVLGLEITQTYKGASSTSKIMLNTLLAIGIAAVCMLAYIAIRFEFVSGLSAIIALCHDVLIMLVLTAIFRIQVNSAFIAAIITIIGYSINNTIVVFDRVRENWKSDRYLGNKVSYIVNISIKETLVRTLNTSITTLCAVLLLAFLGTASVREFVIPIIFGLVAGTFSSMFIAGPLFGVIADNKHLQPRRKKIGN